MLIDFHAHVYQDEVADRVIGRMEEFYGIRRRYDATASHLLESMAGADFERAVVLPVFTKPEHIELNRWYAKLKESSGGRLVPFGGIHPENDPRELELFPELGLVGIKLQPNAQRFRPDDPAVFPLYEKASELGLIVVFHSGNEASGPPAELSRPSYFASVLERFPELTAVIAHMGGYKAWDEVACLFPFKNAYFDTAFLPTKIGEAHFMELVDQAGIERVLFGTDFPFRDHAEENAWMERVLGRRRTAMLHDNAAKMLGI